MARRTRNLVIIALTLVAALWLASEPGIAGAQGAGPVSLRQLTHEADAVVHARITVAPLEIEAGGQVYPAVQADVLTTLKGSVGPGTVVFANVGAEASTFISGEEVLLFLRHLERVAELAATPLQARLRYVAIPNAGEIFVLTDANRPALIDAVRSYAALGEIHDPEQRADALRQLTLALLKSGQPILITSVMRDLAPGSDAAALRLADLSAMIPLIESPRVPIGTRIAMVADLERRGLVFGPARWVRLLRTSTDDDLLLVIRAVGEHPSAGVTAYLIPLLSHRDAALATAAATALGVPGNVDAVRPLMVSLGRDDRALRLAALHSLARIGTQSARQAIEMVAAQHPDPYLRERAETEAIVMARRQGTTLAATLGLTVSDTALVPVPDRPPSNNAAP